MAFRAKPIEIPTEKGSDPFVNDKLNRRPSAESLTNVLSATPGPLVCAVDGGWGAGKTTFLKMWRQHLNNEGFSTVYFSAWESDFADDALISLVGELDAAMGEFGEPGAPLVDVGELWDGVKRLATSLFRRGVPAAVAGAATAPVDGGLGALTVATAAVAGDQMDHYADAKRDFSDFKKQIEAFAKAVAGEAEDGSKRPLVVIIDELDRCRPSYAIQVLERVKHLFDVPNIVFVMAMNRAEMAHSVRAVYGEKMDAAGYLRRFFDLEFLLPPPADDVFLESLFERFDLDGLFEARTGDPMRYDKKHFFELFEALFPCFGLTLRDQEQCFGQVSVALMSVPSRAPIYPDILGTLMVIKQKDPQYYQKIVRGAMEPLDVMDHIRETGKGKDFLRGRSGVVLQACLALCSSDASRSALVEQYNTLANDSSDEAEKSRCQRVVRMIENSWEYDITLSPQSFQNLVGLIEQAPSFSIAGTESY